MSDGRRGGRARTASCIAALGALAALAVLGTLAVLGGPALSPPAAHAATIAYPDLQVLVPGQEISIVRPNSTTKQLTFSHITWNAGTGPLEIRPSYNSLTGISQGFQALYSSPSPGVWTFDHTTPIVGPMYWEPPEDYRFPLAKFWLYGTAAGGGPGSLVASSPKVEFCMTSDVFVGGVPNAPQTNGYPPSNCGQPEGTLGLSVGWGDKYDGSDGGENIDISTLPDGTYWLRAAVDPYHYLEESNRSNDITDTKLRVEGETVKILEQTHPDSTPPTVTLTSPAAETTVSGNVTLSATASGPHAVSSVQFLLDGQPLGAPVTTSPYTMTWTVGNASPGTHYLSAQASDAEGFVGTAPAVPVSVKSKIGAVTIDASVNQTGKNSSTTPAFSTSSPGDILLAFADSDGPLSRAQTLTVSGAGLTWKPVQRANAQPGDAEIWTATAPGALTNATVTATAGLAGYRQSLSVVALSGASGIGHSAGAGGPSGAPSVSLFSSQAGSAAFATGNDWDGAAARTLGPGQAPLWQYLDKATGDTYWTQYLEAPSSAAEQAMTLNDSAPTNHRWNLAAVEVIPGTAPPPPPDTEPPTVTITNPGAGQTVSGQAQVAATVTDKSAISSLQFYLNGQPLGAPVTSSPYGITWDTTTAANGNNTLTAKATDAAGNIGTSPSVTVKVENPSVPGPCFVMDVKVSAEGRNAVTTQPFTTGEAGEVLLAFVAADGPAGAGRQSATVSGAGLTWTPVKRANARSGDAEIWTATAIGPLSGATVTSTLATSGYDQSLTVIAEQMTKGVGASATAAGASGAPSVTLTTSGPKSLVFAVGNDWDKATARTLGPNQLMLHQFLNTRSGDAFWSQYTGQVTGPTGEAVTLNDTAPTTDQWNMAAVELVNDDA